MAYEFVENKYPYDDPNTDLNFNNDILYRHIADDDYKDNYLPSYANGNVKPHDSDENKRYKTFRVNKKKAPETIYVWFIACVIIILLIWYLYSNMSYQTDDGILHDVDTSQFVVVSTDMGNFKALIR